MPIFEEVQIGRHTGTQLIFGTGDISMAAGYLEGEEPDLKNVVMLSQDTEKPQAAWANENGEPVGHSDNLEGPVVQMIFTNPYSIAMLIEVLEEAKNSFNS